MSTAKWTWVCVRICMCVCNFCCQPVFLVTLSNKHFLLHNINIIFPSLCSLASLPPLHLSFHSSLLPFLSMNSLLPPSFHSLPPPPSSSALSFALSFFPPASTVVLLVNKFSAAVAFLCVLQFVGSRFQQPMGSWRILWTAILVLHLIVLLHLRS